MRKTNFAICAAVVATTGFASVGAAAPFKVFMISSTAADHVAMSAAAKVALAEMGMTNDFTVDATTDSSLINDANLAKYDVFLQMHRTPFEIKTEQRAPFENFIKSGKGWVGVHAAGVVVPGVYTSNGQPNWDFYAELVGGLSYVTHPMLQIGRVIIEDRTHPVMRNMPAMFQIRDEFYEWSMSPRPNVHVLGRADETSYTQVKPAGDHPLIWTCEKYRHAIYIQTGHDPADWQNATYSTLIRDALLWAAGRLDGVVGDGGADAADGAIDGSGDGPADTPAAMDVAVDATGSGGTGGQAPDAAVDTTGSTGGAGPGGGSGGQGMGGASGPASSGDGCGCRVVAADAGTAPLFLLLLGVALAACRRRRAR